MRTVEHKGFVVVEGGSGVGKTTALKGLKENLTDWEFYREPGGTPFGELMRDAVQEHKELEIDPVAAFMAYSASRANLIRGVIWPALEEGRKVMLDRYWFSTIAYQGRGEGVDKEFIQSLSLRITDGLLPGLVLHYDLLPELALSRKSGCSDEDRYDMKDLDFHRRIYDAYHELAAEYDDIWVMIDASQSPEKVLTDSLSVLEERGLWKSGV